MIKPNLPDDLINSAIVSSEISAEIEASIRKFGIEPLKLCGRMNCDDAVRNHPDMYFVHISDNVLISNKNNCSFEGGCSNITFVNLQDNSHDEVFLSYPYDAYMNSLVLGNKLICNTKYISAEILGLAENHGICPLHVNQGYTKCNICVVDENSIITEDCGIAKTLSSNGYNVLLLRSHAVKIKKYNYGFIGGASGKISKDKLAFFGNIKNHPEYNDIYSFLYSKNVEPISLSSEVLTDYGSLLPI